ncbi:MAG: guanylate kinase [Planctomycetota bacterium]|nr:guanylate kinase [Planctomycetota bacterium]
MAADATPRLIVMSGLSGAGKTTIAERLLRDARFARALTATTRGPRGAEQDGVDYHFLTKVAFQAGIERGDFLEHAVVYDRLYGTPRANVQKILDSGRHCVLVVDVQGAASLRALGIEATYVFVKAPSLEQLEARLRGRAQDDDDEIQARLEAVKRELAEEPHFDVVLVNETVEVAARELARHLGIDLADG